MFINMFYVGEIQKYIWTIKVLNHCDKMKKKLVRLIYTIVERDIKLPVAKKVFCTIIFV